MKERSRDLAAGGACKAFPLRSLFAFIQIFSRDYSHVTIDSLKETAVAALDLD